MATKLMMQPAFDKRLMTMPFAMAGGEPAGPSGGTGQNSNWVQRGYMIWDTQALPGYTGGYYNDGRDMIQYCFNPSTVEADYSIMNSGIQYALDYPNAGDSANVAVPLQQTASWSLFFDRTYELWDGAGATGLLNDPTVIGVQCDVMQFMQFTGMLVGDKSLTTAQVTDASGNTSNQTFSAASGIMQMVPCWAYFGTSQMPSLLSYYGYISEWSVQYTHWSQYMVPIRAVISVSFTMLPNPVNKKKQQNQVPLPVPLLPKPTNGGPPAPETAAQKQAAEAQQLLGAGVSGR